jgi:thioredoxin reductase (NADPH)
MLDLVIVGGGAAGLTAAIYAARAGLDFVVVEQDGYGGGQIQTTSQVDNYPALPGIDGPALAEQLVAHCESLSVPFVYDAVTAVEKVGDTFRVLTDGDPLESRTVLYAAGTVHRHLEVPGAVALEGRGVSYCATCDGAFFESKTVAIVGSGDTAVSEALYLSRICQTVHLLYRKDRLKAAQVLLDQASQCPNVCLHPLTQVLEVEGTDRVEQLRLSTADGPAVLPCDGVFVAIGTVPETAPLAALGVLDESGYVPADETGTTVLPGLFVAGDARTKQLRQFLTAAADGANAVDTIQRFLA